MENQNNENEPSFGSMGEYELHSYLMNGLSLLGWTADVRFTTDDTKMLFEICKETLALQEAGNLTSDAVDALSLEAYNILKHQIMNVHARADCISTLYFNSVNMKPLLPFIDEALLSFYRGYDSASLAIMFIVLERYLRNVIQWTPAQGDVPFLRLREAVLSLPNNTQARIAHKIISTIYARYDGRNPTQFYFNRHSLLHGLRGSTEYDQMNCVRIFNLFDRLCSAENIRRTAYGDCLEMMKQRLLIYSQCRENEQELRLLSIVY